MKATAWTLLASRTEHYSPALFGSFIAASNKTATQNPVGVKGRAASAGGLHCRSPGREAPVRGGELRGTGVARLVAFGGAPAAGGLSRNSRDGGGAWDCRGAGGTAETAGR